MARPLREQFAVGTLLLLLPVCGVVIWSARFPYKDQVAELQREGTRLAMAIATHIGESANTDQASLTAYLGKIELPEGSQLVVKETPTAASTANQDKKEKVVASFGEVTDEVAVASFPVPNHKDWSVEVKFPTALAWERASPIYKQMVKTTAIATLFMLGLEALFLRRWLHSLKILERGADRVGAGDLETPPREKMPSRELEHLRDALIEMVDKLRDARESIARQVVEERRMREEVQSLHQQIIRQERLAAIGVLLSGIAHELNNPLQAISGFAELLQRDRELRPDVRGDLGIIQKESRRASGIIRNLSRFGRQQTSTPTRVYLRDTVQSVVELRQRRFSEQNIILDVEEEADHPALAVFNELQQVVLNFVINAEQALTSNGAGERRITIRTREVNSSVRLEVEDSGPGVRPEDESKLFQPFFTTKPPGEGTGLGLSVSYGIIQSYGGKIGYRRGDHGGAVFYFDLPAADN
jgi:C4-dicarboxylate-specific signal transduction histidine kinase